MFLFSKNTKNIKIQDQIRLKKKKKNLVEHLYHKFQITGR